MQRLSTDQRERYSRQILLPEIGAVGQKRLLQASVAIVGVGGLGSTTALSLAAAGVGHLRIIDPDPVEKSNLHRQTLYREADINSPKVTAALAHINALNPAIRVDALVTRFDVAEAEQLLADCSVVVDGSDNFATRSLLNETCGRLGIPWVYGAAEALSGQLAVFHSSASPGKNACYHCLFPSETLVEEGGCHRRGVLGMLPAVIAQLQAIEAVKLITGWGEPLLNKLLQFESESASFRSFQISADPACCCSYWKL